MRSCGSILLSADHGIGDNNETKTQLHQQQQDLGGDPGGELGKPHVQFMPKLITPAKKKNQAKTSGEVFIIGSESLRSLLLWWESRVLSCFESFKPLQTTSAALDASQNNVLLHHEPALSALLKLKNHVDLSTDDFVTTEDGVGANSADSLSTVVHGPPDVTLDAPAEEIVNLGGPGEPIEVGVLSLSDYELILSIVCISLVDTD